MKTLSACIGILLLPIWGFAQSATRTGLFVGYSYKLDANKTDYQGSDRLYRSSHIRTAANMIGGIKFTSEYRPNLNFLLEVRYLYNDTKYTANVSAPDLFSINYTWGKKTYGGVVPIGISKAFTLNDNVQLQGILKEYIGASYESTNTSSGNASITTTNNIHFISAPWIVNVNQFKFHAGAEVGLGVILPKRGIELNVFYVRPQRKDVRSFNAYYDYITRDGVSHSEELRVGAATRIDNVTGQLVIYWK